VFDNNTPFKGEDLHPSVGSAWVRPFVLEKILLHPNCHETHPSRPNQHTRGVEIWEVLPNLENLKLPAGLEIEALWELKGKIYTVWDIQKHFVHLKDSEGSVTAFKLEQVLEGRTYPRVE
jgi:hypothetical protein